MIRLKSIAVGDRWPYPYFRLWEKKLVSGKFVKQEIDLSADFQAGTLRVSIRHEDNQDDIDDHTKDDIYAAVNIDSVGLCHYEWAVGDTDTLGVYIGRLTGVRSGGEIWHSDIWFTYEVVSKSRYGRATA